ncbi:cytoplasmic protein [Moniliophthora roreri]|nr:cytoplasmic protein [Moniliophthora roreri]
MIIGTAPSGRDFVSRRDLGMEVWYTIELKVWSWAFEKDGWIASALTMRASMIPVQDQAQAQALKVDRNLSGVRNSSYISGKPYRQRKVDLLLACRYGDLENVQAFVQKHEDEPLSSIRDENSNTILDMVMVPIRYPQICLVKNTVYALFTQNNYRSTALNSHLSTTQKLVQFPGGPGTDLIDIKNAATRC